MKTHGRRGADPEPSPSLQAGAGEGRTAVERVRKRDGRVVTFQRDKISAAVEAATKAVGEPDPSFAAEIAAVVELTLLENARRARRGGAGGASPVPTIEEIQDLVERALMELGRATVAKAYILYRDQRARIREAVRVHRSKDPHPPIRVREAEGISTWSKGRIVAALLEEAELPREPAEEVAAAVERRVFASGLKRITTGLVRELVASELFERGLLSACASLGSLKLSRADVGRLLRSEPLFAWESQADERLHSVRGRIGGELLRRHALEDLLSEGGAELHRAGDLHIEDLRAPHRALSLCVDTELLASGGHASQSAFGVLEGAAELARRASRFVVLERPGKVLSPLLRSVRPGSPLGIAGWLRSLGAIARAAGIRIDLGASGSRYRAWNARLIEEAALLTPGPNAPAVYLEGHELEELLVERPELESAVERLFADGRLTTVWGDEEQSFAGPGCHRLRREPGLLSCGGAIALNLPRLARRAGPYREELVQRGITELVRAALEVADTLERHQRAADPAHVTGLHTRRAFAIVPVGLREALLTLGDGEIDPDQGARLLGLVAEAASRLALGSSPAVAPTPFFGEAAARRFAWLDHLRSREEGAQRWLFDDVATGSVSSAPAAYCADFRLSPVAGARAGRFEAEAQKTLRAGAAGFVGVPGPRDLVQPTPHLAAWRRFEVLRRAKKGEVVLDLFPQPAFSRPGPPSSLRPLV